VTTGSLFDACDERDESDDIVETRIKYCMALWEKIMIIKLTFVQLLWEREIDGGVC